MEPQSESPKWVKNPHTTRISDALKFPERELLERFLLEVNHGFLNPIDAHGVMGVAMESVVREHETRGKEALYQPDQEYSSVELVDMIAKTIFKPKIYDDFKARLDEHVKRPEKTQTERIAEQRAAAKKRATASQGNVR